MKKLLEYLPFHFLLFLIAGICVQFYMDAWRYGITKLLLCLLALFILALLFKKRTIFRGLVWLLFFFLGILSVFIQDATKKDSYFENHTYPNHTSVFVVKEVLKPTEYYAKYFVEVTQIGSQKTSGVVLLNIRRDSLSKQLKVDQKLFVQKEFSNLKPPLNPHQFNYKKYLAKLGIYQQVFVESNEFFLLETDTKSLLGIIADIRLNIQQSLQRYNFSKDEYGVINALLLGQRKEASKELVNDYAKAGAIHILAISGLHVGIILLVISFLLKPLERIFRGKSIQLILIVLILWFFALLAGMSASVVRAVTMFSAVAFGQFLNRRNAIEYSLIFSMFVLLLCKPLFLFDVGFQLSYLAVFGIVWIQPKLYSFWIPRSIILDKLWQLITVSVAAQLGVLPLSLYYFHQFPSLFLLSNLVIIPFLGIILICGIIIILLLACSLLPQSLADGYGFVISLLNRFIQFIARQESFLLKDISFSIGVLITSYFLIILASRFFIKRNVKRLLLFLGAVVALQSVLLYEKYKTIQHNEFLVFHKNRTTILGKRRGKNLIVYHNLDPIAVRAQQLLIDYKVGEEVKLIFKTNLPNLLFQGDQQILIVDERGIYKFKELKHPIVILKQSPKINVNRLISTLQPSQVIADGSNYKSYVSQWKVICLQTKTPFWDTSQNGVYIVK